MLGAPGPCSDSENQLIILSITLVQGVKPTCEFEEGWLVWGWVRKEVKKKGSLAGVEEAPNDKA